MPLKVGFVFLGFAVAKLGSRTSDADSGARRARSAQQQDQHVRDGSPRKQWEAEQHDADPALGRGAGSGGHRATLSVPRRAQGDFFERERCERAVVHPRWAIARALPSIGSHTLDQLTPAEDAGAAAKLAAEGSASISITTALVAKAIAIGFASAVPSPARDSVLVVGR